MEEEIMRRRIVSEQTAKKSRRSNKNIFCCLPWKQMNNKREQKFDKQYSSCYDDNQQQRLQNRQSEGLIELAADTPLESMHLYRDAKDSEENDGFVGKSQDAPMTVELIAHQQLDSPAEKSIICRPRTNSSPANLMSEASCLSNSLEQPSFMGNYQKEQMFEFKCDSTSNSRQSKNRTMSDTTPLQSPGI